MRAPTKWFVALGLTVERHIEGVSVQRADPALIQQAAFDCQVGHVPIEPVQLTEAVGIDRLARVRDGTVRQLVVPRHLAAIGALDGVDIVLRPKVLAVLFGQPLGTVRRDPPQESILLAEQRAHQEVLHAAVAIGHGIGRTVEFQRVPSVRNIRAAPAVVLALRSAM